MLKDIFKIDPKSLGLFRIGLGLMLVLDAGQKLLLSPHFYTDWGVMPRAYWIENYMSTWKWSLHLASGSTWFQVLLIALQLITAAMYMLGYRSKITGSINLILLMSLHSRNNLVLSAADDIMKLGLFFSLFLPLDARFSFFKKPETKVLPAQPVASAAIMLQLIYMYIFTAILKWHPIWHTEGSAIYYATHIDMYGKPLALWLRQYEGLMRVATFATLVFEFIGPITALIPGRSRLISALLFMGFHVGLFFSFEIGLFPLIAIVYWILFLTPHFWNAAIGQKIEQTLEKLIAKCAFEKSDTSSNFQSPQGYKLTTGFTGTIIVLLGIYNIDTLELRDPLLPKPIKAVIHIMNLNQVWNMFAPYPIKNDGWFVIEGTFTDGSKMDLMTKKPATYEKPLAPADAYPSSEWRKFMLHVWDEGKTRILLPFGRYLCRSNSASYTQSDKVISTIRIDFVKETTPPPGQNAPPVEVRNLWNHDCFAK